MEIRYSPKVDADLEAAFLAESCRGAAELSGETPQAALERQRQADSSAARLFTARWPDAEDRPLRELLEEMIALESYRASELFPLFAREARHDGAEELAALFEARTAAAAEQCRRLEKLRGELKSFS